MIQFTPGDAMECAIKIEENGETFYRHMAEKFHESEVNKLFTYLLEEEIDRIKNKKSAIDFAIRAELESILYYEEMKKFVREKDHNIFEKIIEEERKHFLELSALNAPSGRGSLLNTSGGWSL